MHDDYASELESIESAETNQAAAFKQLESALGEEIGAVRVQIENKNLERVVTNEEYSMKSLRDNVFAIRDKSHVKESLIAREDTLEVKVDEASKDIASPEKDDDYTGISAVPLLALRSKIVLARRRVFSPHLRTSFTEHYRVIHQVGEGTDNNFFEAEPREPQQRDPGITGSGDFHKG